MIKIPPEMGYTLGMVGLVKNFLYGIHNIAANWEVTIKDVMLAFGFSQVRSNAYLYFHEGRRFGSRCMIIIFPELVREV